MATPRPAGPAATGDLRLLSGEHRVVALDDADDDSENAQGGGKNFLDDNAQNRDHATSLQQGRSQQRTLTTMRIFTNNEESWASPSAHADPAIPTEIPLAIFVNPTEQPEKNTEYPAK